MIFRRGVLFLLLPIVFPGCTPNPGQKALAEPDLFAEVSQSVGLEFRHFIGASGEFFLPEIMGSGVGVFDYDGDGDLDIYFLQGAMLDDQLETRQSTFPPPTPQAPVNRLFRNLLSEEGHLRFEDVTGRAAVGDAGYGMGVAVGDIDGDGDPDLYLTNFGNNVLYRNEGNGTFTDISDESATADSAWSTSASFFDYDRDGDLDLFVANYLDFQVSANQICSGPLARQDYCHPLVYPAVPDRLFRNEGQGRFMDVSESSGISSAAYPGLGVVAADFNQDGWPDLYVGNDRTQNQLWINQQDGTFLDRALLTGAALNGDGRPEATMGVTAGDIDGDGDEDLFMTHYGTETNTLYINDGAGGFRDDTYAARLAHPSLSLTGWGTEWFDFDSDGLLDLLVANGGVSIVPSQLGQSSYPYQERNQLFQNRIEGGFVERTDAAGEAFTLLEVSRGAAYGDLDNDGDVDVVIANNNGLARVLLNQSASQSSLTVALRSKGPNKEAVGARVALIREGRAVAWRRVHRDGSYLSSLDIRVHFGLGSGGPVEAVGVIWPDGSAEMWREIENQRFLELVAGAGEAWLRAR